MVNPKNNNSAYHSWVSKNDNQAQQEKIKAKHHTTAARWIVILSSITAGMLIWLALNRVPSTTSSSSSITPNQALTATQIAAVDPNFSATDTFLNQPPGYQPPVQYQSPVQSSSVQSPRFRSRGS